MADNKLKVKGIKGGFTGLLIGQSFRYNTNMNKHKLSNGLQVLQIPQAGKDVASALFLTRTGSRYETKATNGLSRFYALMSMKKTQNYPSQIDILDVIDRLGAYVSIETNREYTALYAKSGASSFEQALDILGDMIVRPQFDAQDVDNERKYFYAEIDNRQADPSGKALDQLFSLVYGDNPLAYSGVGSRDSVATFTDQMLNEFRTTNYTAENGLLVVHSDGDAVMNKLEEVFADLPHGEVQSPDEADIMIDGDKNHHTQMHGQQMSTFALGFPAYSRNVEHKYIQILLEIILGKTKSNMRLGKISHEDALARSATTGLYQFADSGLFVVQVAGESQKISQAYSRTLQEIDRLTSELVSNEELEKAKGYYRGMLELGLHDPIERSFFYGLQDLLEDNIESSNDFLAHIDSVSAEQIQAAAQAIFNVDNAFVVSVGEQVG